MVFQLLDYPLLGTVKKNIVPLPTQSDSAQILPSKLNPSPVDSIAESFTISGKGVNSFPDVIGR
jgi:hypothetical protein